MYIYGDFKNISYTGKIMLLRINIWLTLDFLFKSYIHQLISIPKRFFNWGSFKSNIINLRTIKTVIFISSPFSFLKTMIGIWMEYFHLIIFKDI